MPKGGHPIATIDPASRLAFAGFILDEADERLIGPAGPVRIGFKAYRLLQVLARAGGKLLTKDEIFDSVWDGAFVSESALTSVIKELRRALGDEPSAPRFIETVYGRGYRFIPAVEELTAAPETSPDLETGAAASAGIAGSKRQRLTPGPVNRRRSRVAATGRTIAATVSIIGSVAALIGFIQRDRAAGLPPAAGVEIGVIAADGNVPPNLPTAIRDQTLRALSYSHSVAASLPGGAVQQPYVLTGSLRRNDDQLQVDFNLVSRRTGQNVWAWSDQEPIANPDFARDYGETVAQVLRCALNAAVTKPDLSEHTLALLFQLCGPPSGTRIQGKIELARRVIADDPNFAPAWAALATELGQTLYDGVSSDPTATRLEGVRAVTQALRIDPQSAYAWYAMSVLVPLDQLARREDYLQRALKARPLDCGCLHKYLGDFYFGAGRWSDAQAEYERVLDQEPDEDGARFMSARIQLDHDPASLEGLAWLAHAQRPRSAIALLRVETDFNTGNYNKALTDFDLLEKAAPGTEIAATKAAIGALASGSREARTKAAAHLREGIGTPGKRGMFDVQLLSALGDPQGALHLAEAVSAKSHDRGLIPLFSRMSAPARQLPEFASFAARMGLTSYWRDRHITPDFCRVTNSAPVCATIRP